MGMRNAFGAERKNHFPFFVFHDVSRIPDKIKPQQHAYGKKHCPLTEERLKVQGN